MHYSSTDIKRIEDFQKYARFICDHFDIEVQLDSTKAETDGRVISLPNIVGMSDQELDMMYTILLHEAGHIKFSTFTVESFAQLKTKSHAHLANAIEDARIENLLMKEFAGAPEMFQKLYCEYAVNRKLMKKVFNISGKRPDLFNCLGIYIHAYLLDCKTAAFSRVATRENYKKVKAFVKKHHIHKLLDHASLKNWKHVIQLTNTIYDLFTKEFDDKSEKCSFKADLELKEKVEEALATMQKKIKDIESKMEPIQQEIDKQAISLENWEKDNAEDLNNLDFEQRKLGEQSNDLNNEMTRRSRIASAKNNVNTKTNIANNLEAKANSLKNDIKLLKDNLASGLNARGKPFTEKQTEAQNKSIESKNGQLKNVEKKLQEANQKISDAKKELSKVLDTPSKPSFAKMTDEELSELNQQISEELKDISNQYDALNAIRTKIENTIDTLQQKIDNAITNLQIDIMNDMYKFDQQGNAQNIDMDVLPEFSSTPGWDEADKAQREFDKDASKEKKEIVRNGGRAAGLIGTNLRDLSAYIDNKIEKVKSINLLEIFEKKAGISRFPQFNEGANGLINNTLTDKSVRSDWGSVEKHTALTTQFDIVQNSNTPKDKKETDLLLSENVSFIRSLKRTFLNKFKFSKKDYYRGGKEDGQLDNRNLWKLPTRQGDDFYEINTRKPINQVAASILIDISGSQDKEETDYGKKLKVLALALSESLKSVHIKHEILGFHAPVNDEMREADASYSYNRRSNNLETLVYKTFSQNDNKAICNIDLQFSDNSDGESIRIALQRLKRERSKSKILFIITDGKPFLSDADITILDEDLKTALREAIKNKTQIFSLGFSPNGKDFYGERFCHIQDYSDVIQFIEKSAL